MATGTNNPYDYQCPHCKAAAGNKCFSVPRSAGSKIRLVNWVHADRWEMARLGPEEWARSPEDRLLRAMGLGGVDAEE
jgi:hypothetical protein